MGSLYSVLYKCTPAICEGKIIQIQVKIVVFVVKSFASLGSMEFSGIDSHLQVSKLQVQESPDCSDTNCRLRYES